jgi:putative addiction module component (TIGR02574 family)
MKAISELAKDALRLPSDQRLRLARILLDLSEDNPESAAEVESAWEEEICRRMKAVEEGTAQARPLEEVFAELDRRFPS